MPRRNPNMTICTNAVVKQTFLLSPTPSLTPTSLRVDSPVLPPSPAVTLFHANYVLCDSAPTSNLPAYPTSRTFYDDRPSSVLPYDRSGSLSGNSCLSNAASAIADCSASRRTRMSDILPDDLDFYSEEEDGFNGGYEDTRMWSIPPLTDAGQDVVLEQVREAAQREQELKDAEQEAKEMALGLEIRAMLPVIREGDYPYYPLPSYFPQSKVEREKGRVNKAKGRKLVRRNGNDSSSYTVLVKRLLRRLFHRRGKGKT